jgi:hypothetical protein
MFKINLKIQWMLFVVCLFMIGFEINKILDTGLKSGMDLFWQIGLLVPFVISAFIFGNNIYSKKALEK